MIYKVIISSPRYFIDETSLNRLMTLIVCSMLGLDKSKPMVFGKLLV